ncbi:MAG: aminotransferase class I/II-fold pyridoxal phosphate-dependent enzyme [Chlamydiales bacterium]|nr:aminotransferase class I/II-fold pyridoxal phosphate-dependent enzyme [Chlamydiales bacterium]
MDRYQPYKHALEKKREQKEFRQLRCVAGLEEQGLRSRVNFASSDFLGLASHPYVKKNTIKSVLEWGAGTSSSRLDKEHLECHREVEQRLAALVGRESALLFPSSSPVHEHLLKTLIHSRCLIFIDRYANQHLTQAATKTGAQVFRYEHGNFDQLSSLLEKTGKNISKWIITESLFGMNGEAISLKTLGELAEMHGALTYVDDSNTIGVLGKHGMGLASHRRGIDVMYGSFGKESGCIASFIACSQLFRDYLLTFNPELIETTTLPPAALGAISACLDLIPDMEIERKKIEEAAARLRHLLIEHHWDIGKTTSHLIPILCRHEEECDRLSKALLEQSILVTTLKPPLVPQGGSRLRLTVTALQKETDLSYLLKTLESLKEEPSLSTV